MKKKKYYVFEAEVDGFTLEPVGALGVAIYFEQAERKMCVSAQNEEEAEVIFLSWLEDEYEELYKKKKFYPCPIEELYSVGGEEFYLTPENKIITFDEETLEVSSSRKAGFFD